MMFRDIWLLLIPLAGTVLGAGCVLFLRKEIGPKVESALSGFAAGVMVAASVWSLLIPAMKQSSAMESWAFVPAVVGLWAGVLLLLLLDNVIPHLHSHEQQEEGPRSKLKRTTKLVFAVTLHNFPEGMAVGISYAGWLAGYESLSMAGVLALAIGIAIQNFPEGAIVSMPLRSEGLSRKRAFAYGALSGVVEPVGAVLTVLMASFLVPALPYLLSLSAGAMLYVVVEDLIPQMSGRTHSNVGTLMFALGFSLMMILDVALG